MIKNSQPSLTELVIQEGATALVGAAFAFLRRNNISKKLILKSVHKADESHGRVPHYRRLVRAYEDMGIVMSTWYSLPTFLDSDGRPLPLTTDRGVRSVANLVRLSRVRIRLTLALELLRRSPSVRIDVRGNFVATKRVFVLPDFEVPRAALVIQRYLDTLRKNTSAQKNGTSLLLERNCHVPEIDVRRISPTLRDIKERGTAFMDSVDGDIEAYRTRKSRQSVVGELGVLIFAWTQRSTPRRSKASLVNQLGRTSSTAHRSIPHKARAR
jgi:hypothetical protein